MSIKSFQLLTFSDSPLPATHEKKLKTQDIKCWRYFKNTTNNGTINSNKNKWVLNNKAMNQGCTDKIGRLEISWSPN